MTQTLRLLLLSCCLVVAQAAVTVSGGPGDYRLLVDGEPYYVQGVTWGGGAYDETRWRRDFELVKQMGGNSIRTWGVGADTGKLLDMAQEYGVTVMLGIWMRHGRSGAEGDDNFNWATDTQGVADHKRRALEAVAAYGDHPALLCWGVGNEVMLNIGPENEKIAYAKALGDICAAMKAANDRRPIASVGAWTIPWPYWKAHAPAIDIYAVNTYGYGAAALPGEVERLAIDRPYMITEFGATGEWEVKANEHGVKMDPSEAEKYGIIAEGWQELIAKHAGVNLGCYVFHLGNGFDQTGLWLGLRSGDRLRPAFYGCMQAWAGKEPENRLPVVERFDLHADSAKPGTWVAADLTAVDPEGGALDIRFAFNDRHGERHYSGGVHPLESRPRDGGGYELKMPSGIDNRGIKVYALVDDGVNLSLAQDSLLVGSRAGTAAPVGKPVALPLTIYAEGNENSGFVASGLMGNHAALQLDYESTTQAFAGRHCLRIHYAANDNWIGVAWQKPANDWGQQPGGIDVSAGKRLRFMARGGQGGEKINVHFGMIGPDSPYYDTARIESGDLVLSDQWQQYEIAFGDRDVSHMKTPFAFFFGGQGRPIDIYIDDIVIE